MTMTSMTAVTEPVIPADEVVHKGYTYGQLREAFTAAHDPKDWKAPISVWVPGEAVMLTVAAIEFYTATNPKVQLNTETMRYLITSEGYRQGPAGDW